ncbi:Uncharacterized protein Rs2_05088 [Raphanus sativus]|nr:Uncharacterized protein Rs2_05088 [Raphanus sativus]
MKSKSLEAVIKKDLPEISPDPKAQATKAKARGEDTLTESISRWPLPLTHKPLILTPHIIPSSETEDSAGCGVTLRLLQRSCRFGDNLRKSLAWDKAFFINAASVLEPDELCHMIETNHLLGEKKVLATIQEDVKRSTGSISSTLKSDCCSSTVETSQDRVLFEDVVTASSQSSAAFNLHSIALLHRLCLPLTVPVLYTSSEPEPPSQSQAQFVVNTLLS